MSGTLTLSTADQWRVTLALELDNAGFHAAADYLRKRVTQLDDVWAAQAAEDRAALSHLNTPSDLFHLHRGSTPPAPTS